MLLTGMSGAGKSTVLAAIARRIAVAADLARYKGLTRAHTATDLNSYLHWCQARGLPPLEAQRAQIEVYLRWLQEVRRLRPSTVARRLSVVGVCCTDW